jgi:hypothetical protein
MTKLLEQALREVQQLSADDQNAVAGALLDYVKHMRDVALSDAQLEEVSRRRRNPDRQIRFDTEAREHIRKFGS